MPRSEVAWQYSMVSGCSALWDGMGWGGVDWGGCLSSALVLATGSLAQLRN